MPAATPINSAAPVETEHSTSPTQNARLGTAPAKKLFGVPPPVKRVFDKFPLTTYDADRVPGIMSANGSDARNRLFVFIGHEEAAQGAPSFNPQCLRWQVSHGVLRNSDNL